MFRTGQFTPQLKLLYHTDKIQQWLAGDNIYPILVEFDLANACNHRCSFCTFNYIKDKSLLDLDVALRTIAQLNCSAINWTGGGEPLVHSRFSEISRFTKECGIKQGLFTNGSLITKSVAETILDTHEWVRISLDAGCAETFKRIKGVDQFTIVLNKVRNLVDLRGKRSKPDIGIGFVITPDNYKDIPKFSKLVKSLKVDYGQFKPCIQNFKINWQFESKWWREKVIPLLEHAVASNPKIVVNDYKFKDLLDNKHRRDYDICYGHNFVPCIGADGNVWLCTHMRDIKEYSLGNLYEQSFKEIWMGERRQEVIREIDFKNCQFCCKNHEINKALYTIKHPTARHHGDFL